LQFVFDDFAEGFTLTVRPGFWEGLVNEPDGRVGGFDSSEPVGAFLAGFGPSDPMGALVAGFGSAW
jgi:hypothetical protein